jgi:hypothetical protein
MQPWRAVRIERRPAALVWREGDLGRDAAGRRAKNSCPFASSVAPRMSHFVDRIAQGLWSMHGGTSRRATGRRGQFAEDAHDAAGAMHVLDVVLGVGRDLAQARHLARERSMSAM